MHKHMVEKKGDLEPEDCKGCHISGELGDDLPIGGLVRLPGDWTLNHYGGSEGYLGWLALQPYEHRMAFSKLSPEELCHLGPNIHKVEKYVCMYWKQTYAGDPIEKLYVIYFFDGGDPYHVHLHLIPRFKHMDTKLQAWNVPEATMSATFRSEYQRGTNDSDKEVYEKQVWSLMNYLREKLPNTDE